MTDTQAVQGPDQRPVEESLTAAIRSVVGSLAGQLKLESGPIPPGDRAELRRGWNDPFRPAFWRVAVRVLEPAGLLGDPKRERHWAAVLAGLAESADLHRPRHPFGRAMKEAGVSEARLLRLLRADGESLRDALRGVVHQLRAAGQRFDWAEPALLLLHPDKKDAVRKRIAMGYYRPVSTEAAKSRSQGE
jgi:CRISPR type I-E-associated protein CasB/Cse2